MVRRAFTACLLFVSGTAWTLLSTTPAVASITCTGFIRNQTLESLDVPSGVECVLLGVRINGDVQVEPGGALATNLARVSGQVSGYRATVQLLSSSFVGGSVNLVQPVEFRRSDGSVLVSAASCGSTVNGDFAVQGALGSASILLGGDGCRGNTIGGNLVDSNNQTSFNVLTNNHIGGYLVCQGDSPAPTGGANTASAKIGQCAGL